MKKLLSSMALFGMIAFVAPTMMACSDDDYKCDDNDTECLLKCAADCATASNPEKCAKKCSKSASKGGTVTVTL